MNFEDIIYAVSTFFTLYLVIAVPIDMLMPRINPEIDVALGWFISGIIPALIVGFIFGGRMAKSKLTSIAKILVVVTVLFGLFLPSIVGFMDWNNYQAGNPNSTLQAQDFVLFMRSHIFKFIAINFIPLLPAMFIGLYAGLSLKKATF